MSLRTTLGALLHDVPRFERHIRGRWVLIRNRNERIEFDGRGVRCHWQFTSDLHIAKVFPSAGVRLMRRALRDWPIAFADAPAPGEPRVTFVIGHRGLARLPHLIATLKTIAAQRDVIVECVVVEQSAQREIDLPSWVRYVHTPVADGYDYNRAWTLNAGVAAARGEIVVLHDNDMLVPARYAAELAAQNADFFDLKRFTFYLGEEDTARFFENGALEPAPSTVVQNLQGASIAARKSAFEAIGGFDQSFVGWGAEDNEFWDRAQVGGRVMNFGYLPFVHLWHAPQKGKLQGQDAPALRRYEELKRIAPEERIRRLKASGVSG